MDAPSPARVPTIEADRRLWLARYNPADPDFDVPDIDDDSKFPWAHPEAAPRDGWWLSSLNTPKGRTAIAEISTGDLVICQRTDPKQDRDPADTRRDNMLVGVCVIGMKDSWDDAGTGLREHRGVHGPPGQVQLSRSAPYGPQPSPAARRELQGPPPAPRPWRPHRLRTLCGRLDDAVELLSVCGIPPEASRSPTPPGWRRGFAPRRPGTGCSSNSATTPSSKIVCAGSTNAKPNKGPRCGQPARGT